MKNSTFFHAIRSNQSVDLKPKIFRSLITQSNKRFFGLPASLLPGMKYGLMILAHGNFFFGDYGHTILVATALVACPDQQDLPF